MKYAIIAIGLLLAVNGCAPKVTVASNSRTNLNKYQTYAWMDSDVKAGQNPLYYNQIATDNVENTMNKVLTDKGLKAVTVKPDLLIGYHFFVEDKTRTVSTPNSSFYGPYGGWGRWGFGGWGPGYWGWGGSQQYQEQYKDGTLVVDMVDARTRKLVWRGSVENAVGNPAQISSNLPKEAARIAEKFPNRNS